MANRLLTKFSDNTSRVVLIRRMGKKPPGSIGIFTPDAEPRRDAKFTQTPKWGAGTITFKDGTTIDTIWNCNADETYRHMRINEKRRIVSIYDQINYVDHKTKTINKLSGKGIIGKIISGKPDKRVKVKIIAVISRNMETIPTSDSCLILSNKKIWLDPHEYFFLSPTMIGKLPDFITSRI